MPRRSRPKRPDLSRALPDPRSSSGFALIEVLMSSMLVAVIAAATFTGFDVSNRVTGEERARNEAVLLAHQDEERLRGLSVYQLSGLNETKTNELKYNGISYTVTSKGKYVSDTSSEASCGGEGQNADYIQTVSEVKWPGLKTRPAVVETGLIAPQVGGSVLVQIRDDKAKPTGGMTTTLTGPKPSAASESYVSPENGCVIFGSAEPGEFTVKVFQAGYVEKDGNSEPPAAEQVLNVNNGKTTKKIFEFAKAGLLNVKFKTPGGKAWGDSFVAFNTHMSSPSYRTFGTVNTPLETFSSTMTMFPFG
jgi:type II secretory pathway pseudopilin PulG